MPAFAHVTAAHAHSVVEHTGENNSKPSGLVQRKIAYLCKDFAPPVIGLFGQLSVVRCQLLMADLNN